MPETVVPDVDGSDVVIAAGRSLSFAWPTVRQSGTQRHAFFVARQSQFSMIACPPHPSIWKAADRSIARNFGKVHLLLIVCLIVALTGCTASNQTSIRSPDSHNSFTSFDNFPLPDGSRLDMERTLVLGTDVSWTGRLTFFTSNEPAKVYEFYLTEMPRAGWREIMTVRSAASHLVFDSPNRTATIAIEPGLWPTLETRVDINVVPGGIRELSALNR